MSASKAVSVVGLIAVIGAFSLFRAPLTRAFFLNDWWNGAKSFVSNQQFFPKKNEVEIESSIVFAQDGDLNQNGEFDAGEMVTFIYTVTNLSKKDYDFSTLNTGLAHDAVNFIHNVQGATSLSDIEAITIPNIYLGAGQKLTISFDARINFSSEDQVLSTSPTLVDKDKQLVVTSSPKELRVKARKEKLPSLIQTNTLGSE